MVQIRGTRWAAAAAVIVAVAAGTAGCGGGGGKTAPSTPASAPAATSTAATTTAPAMSMEDAYREYQQTMGPGCTTAAQCQTLMTARLQAVHDLRAAMKAQDPARYSVPIAAIDRADRIAAEYGTDQLGATGTMMAVMQPIQAAISWYASNR